jgi:hypothetical protein
MIQDALTRADKIDQEADAEQRKLNVQMEMLDHELAGPNGDLANSQLGSWLESQLSDVQEGAAQNQLQLIKDSLPDGKNQAEVAAWFALAHAARTGRSGKGGACRSIRPYWHPPKRQEPAPR